MSNSSQNQDSLKEKLKVAFDSNNSDKNYNSGKAIVSSLPAVGSLAVGFFDSYIVSPATQRLHIFLETLVQELEELKSKIESVNVESPIFVTTFMRARQIAICTHQKQKLEALRNIVLNSSIPRSIEDDVLAMFLNWTDYFSELHISTLRHLHYLDRYDPEQLHTYFPKWEEKRAIYNQVLKDLTDRGLILTDNYTIIGVDPKHKGEIDKLLRYNRQSRQVSKTTELGKQFIEFIEYPSIQTEPM
jgi:hypothetical protein